MAERTDSAQPDRRANHTLREVLDELIDLVRDISNRRTDMSDSELDYSQERLQWLAEEVWRLTLEDR